MYFHKTPQWLKMLYPLLTWEIKTKNEDVLFLTFDDGPVPEVTEFVLNTLNKFNAKATFFCVGENMYKNPYILGKILKQGHALGNHTHHHLNGWKSADDVYLNDVNCCDKILSKHLGIERKKLFRPPYGRIKRSQIKKIVEDHEIIMWDVLTGDFDQKLDSNKCLEKSIKFTKNGSIIVFHDSVKAEKNLKHVLPIYLEHFSNLGYKFRSL